jgi:hypothetical protein
MCTWCARIKIQYRNQSTEDQGVGGGCKVTCEGSKLGSRKHVCISVLVVDKLCSCTKASFSNSGPRVS